MLLLPPLNLNLLLICSLLRLEHHKLFQNNSYYSFFLTCLKKMWFMETFLDFSSRVSHFKLFVTSIFHSKKENPRCKCQADLVEQYKHHSEPIKINNIHEWISIFINRKDAVGQINLYESEKW